MLFEEKIEDLIREGIDTFYIYPFGKRGMQIYEFMQTCFEDKKVIRVDNKLCKYNKEIISYGKLTEIMKQESSDENSVILISSDNPVIYRELRIKVARDINKEKVIDLFEWNPLDSDKNNRISALSMIGKQIYENEVKGAVAEAGVYKGEFAKYINMIFPDKTLYLFDTFEGFVQKQIYEEKDNLHQTTWIDGLKDTSVEEVLQKMPYRENVEICKGIFPDTIYNIKTPFAFVNLDMDLYYPIYEGLKFFWDNLSEGGVIFVHDYGNWDGVTNAVKKFCKENQIGYIWLNDGFTVALSKPLGN